MKRILKIIGVLIGVLLLLLALFLFIKHEPLPEGKEGQEAEVLAQKMLTALNHDAYQKTRYLEWTFRNGAHTYKWDKELGLCTVEWDDYIAHINLPHPNKSRVSRSGKQLDGKEKDKAIEKAFDLFNNDSFWLVAPYKILDDGTKRGIVEQEDGSQALLVTYTSGGSTPGDSYLWLLNDDGFPNAYKMWVKILPVGGIEATWDDWMVVESGAFLPKAHKLGPMTLSMGNVRGYNE